MMIVENISDLKDKKVLLRTDFDVPVSDNGKILESFRIIKQKPMIDYLLDKGAKIVMVAHISAIDSFRPILDQLEEILGHKIGFLSDPGYINSQLSAESHKLYLLDNIRKFPGEEENNKEFVQNLSKGFDLYINNAFSVCHREHASASAITGFLPSYAGFIIKEEVEHLENIVEASVDGKIIIIGGAKASTKVPVIKNFLNKAGKILLGGIIANDILREKGQDIGDSEADENTEELLKGLDLNHPKLVLPVDFNIIDNKFLDIGPKTIDEFCYFVKNAKIVVWNGPLGYFENPDYAIGTNKIAEAIVNSDSFKVVGGGETIAAIDRIKLLDKFDFVSTGGGAMLKFLAGEKLPGLEALDYYKS